MQARFGTTRAKGGIWLELRARRKLAGVEAQALTQ
jgi:hypothetical protein